MPNTLEFRAGEDYYFISTSTKLDIHRYRCWRSTETKVFINTFLRKLTFCFSFCKSKNFGTKISKSFTTI
jgi:hypothetical protein